MKLDLKLLCLALVLCQQSVQEEMCTGGASAAKCKGKPGGELELKATDASGPVAWMKGNNPTGDAAKYTKSGTHQETLKSLKLTDDDEGTYKATATGIADSQEFIVNVADCFGGTDEATCQGRVNQALKMKATGASGTVSWVKEGTPTDVPIKDDTPGYHISGTNEESLKIEKLSAESTATYQASGSGITGAQKFKVKVTGGNTNPNPNPNTNTNTTTSVIHVLNRNAKGLSYSPALLVTTLVHLVLQLAY